MESTKTSLILHGHFYQPPRENPYTGIIEKQPSAAPFDNWNERICHECYGANAFSRYLGPDGRIESLTNNYSYLSFNFGHTIMTWLKDKHPIFHDMIVEADRESVRRLGHGNGMAMGYNHTILPLDRVSDAKRQVEWGIEDFIYRFGRMPEGMWLPEAAINSDVIDILSESGIKFVVLSPWQCRAVENPTTHQMDELGPSPAPYAEPYILSGTTGREIAGFFYHPGLASSISFGHALRNADSLYDMLLDIRNTDRQPLIHTATDGEIYGHHEPFGDMALAALIKKVEERNDFEFTNYGRYLADHRPTLRAVLHRGEEGKGTSWSCSHGVSRWYKDCGCHTGGEEGWNQKWRTPLRKALSDLSAKLDDIFASECTRIFGSSVTPDMILDEVAPVFIGKEDMPTLISHLHEKYSFDPAFDTEVASLLLGIQNRHFSFTSCGFFFNDISGIEPRQNIRYALYAMKMFQSYSEEDLLLPFLSELRKAKSNIRAQGDGMSIAQAELKALSGECEASIFFYINHVVAIESDWEKKYGRFVLDSYVSECSDNARIIFHDVISQIRYDFTILSSSTVSGGLNLYLCSNNESRQRYKITTEDIPLLVLSLCDNWVDRATSSLQLSDIKVVVNSLYNFSILTKSSKYLPMKTMILENLGLAMKIFKALSTIHPDSITWEEKKMYFTVLLDFIRKYGRVNETNAVLELLNRDVTKIAYDLRNNGLDDTLADLITEFFDVVRSFGFEPESKTLQNEVYEYYSGRKQSAVSEEKKKKIYDTLNFK
ncbi:MAG: DUF3536 domain-containing protein [Bullifex sp.]|nr:DUF3536 domain-containing protein [Bullifex sp.]